MMSNDGLGQALTDLVYNKYNQQIKEYEILIAALVKMMGGSVVVSEFEMVDADKLTMHAEMQQDPRMFILKVEEPE